MRVLEVTTLAQTPILPGRQLLPSLTQEQPLHLPVLLHLQHTIIAFRISSDASIQISNEGSSNNSR